MSLGRCLSFTLCFALLASISAAAGPPNIVFLLTDDQDVTAFSLDYMPRLNKLMRQGGMEFLNYFVPTGLCCPSRTTIWTGQYCHNHKIWDNGDLNNATYLSGGLPKIIAEGLENISIGTQLKDAGYETFLIGKYTNGYEDGQAAHVPVGWDHWYGMTDTAYYGPHFSVQGKLLKTSEDTYQTDFISNTSLNLLKGRDKTKPFFVYIAPFAPHTPATPAHRHANLFDNFTAPRFPSYNPGDNIQQQKPSWIKRLPPMDSDQLKSTDSFYRNRLRSLQAVDEMLENITLFVQSEGIEDNTFIFYMGDNGQHFADFRIPPGKRQAYDTDVRVPFLVRGPGVKQGAKVTEVVMSVDLLPTWLELGGGSVPSGYSMDGKSMTKLLYSLMPLQPQENVYRSVSVLEMYGGSSNMDSRYKGMAGFEMNRFWNNTYQAIRIINGSDWAANANWMYAEWCTGEREFYNVSIDPHQIANIVDTLDQSLVQKLSALTETMGSCAGSECTNIDFKQIAIQSEKESDKQRLRCFNPPDMPGIEIPDNIWDLASEDLSYCDQVKAAGFPYSDGDVVPDSVIQIWNTCRQWLSMKTV